MATYRMTYTDDRFDDLPEEERRSKIRDLFKQGELRLDTDKRVNMLSVLQIYKDESQNDSSTPFAILVDKIIDAVQTYDRDTDRN
jgi:hypothetical protein